MHSHTRSVPLLLCLLITIMLCSAKRFVNSHATRQHEQLAHVLHGAWKSIDLSTHDAIIQDMDKYMTAASKAVSEGHSGQLVIERKMYYALANMTSINHICEIGFNGGHSASMWLHANSHATVTMFDLFSHPYAETALEYLTSKDAEIKHGLVNVSQRLRVIKGNSLVTVPEFAAEHPHVRCDLLSVDGGHSFDVAVADIKNMRNLANEAFNVLVVDDTNCGAGYCVDEAVNEHERRGTINVLQGYAEHRSESGYERGVTVAQYNRL